MSHRRPLWPAPRQTRLRRRRRRQPQYAWILPLPAAAWHLPERLVIRPRFHPEDAALHQTRRAQKANLFRALRVNPQAGPQLNPATAEEPIGSPRIALMDTDDRGERVRRST